MEFQPIHLQCYGAVAQLKQDPSICERIKISGAAREIALLQCEMIAGR